MVFPHRETVTSFSDVVPIVVSLGVIAAIVALLVGAFCCSSVKTFRKNRKTGDINTWRTKTGITINISRTVDRGDESPRTHRLPAAAESNNQNLLSPDSARVPLHRGFLTRARSYSL